VGRLKPNDFGLFDVHGNVWCWCLDVYREYRPGGPGHVFEDTEEPELTIKRQQDRVVRGGCYRDRAAVVRSANRHHLVPSGHSNLYGFRLARTMARN
jgi:formylglycine-generating enzyme required for sulfatase activity